MKWLQSFPGDTHRALVTQAMLPIVLNGFHMAAAACKLGNKVDVEKLGIECSVFDKVTVSKDGELNIGVWPMLNSSGSFMDLRPDTADCPSGVLEEAVVGAARDAMRKSEVELEELGAAAESVVTDKEEQTNLARHVSGFLL